MNDDDMLVVTMNDIPGYEVVEVYGEVFGVLVRSRNFVSNIGASLKSIVGGEIGGYSKLLSDSRFEAVGRDAEFLAGHIDAARRMADVCGVLTGAPAVLAPALPVG